ncbi:hypothetical protein OPQ81_003846 [Rhizoctonia solani]|nr:hypothetical protein OPQ81_003846 [Rhizoctonia solani]
MLILRRVESFVLFVLSLGLLTCAAPMPLIIGQKSGMLHALAVRGHSDGAGDAMILLGAIVDLKAKMTARADMIVKVKEDALDEAQTEINNLVADIVLCANTIASLKNLNVNAKLKTTIAAHILVTIKTIIKIWVSLTVKFGIQVFLDVFAKLDLCLKLLLRSLDVCMGGFLIVLGELLVEADLKALAETKLTICHDLFILVRAAIGITT